MKRVLVADDEKIMRMIIAGTLKIGNFHVIEVDNGFDALKMAEEEKPDLVILDEMMPGMTGHEVCKHMKSNANLKKTKILLLTAKGQEMDSKIINSYEADIYMSKPFKPAELLNTVNNMLVYGLSTVKVKKANVDNP